MLRWAPLLLAASLLLSSGTQAASSAYTFRPMLTSFAVTHVAAPRSAPGRLYVAGQGGRIQLAIGGRFQPKLFLNIEKLVLSRGAEQGLLSVAFHPAFATNRLFYVDYTGRDANTYFVEYRATPDGRSAVPGSARRIFFARDPGPEHNGGQLAFGPDGKLCVALGDGEATDVRREASTIKGLSTFGEDAHGELYAASVNTGRVYRLTR